MKRSLFSLILTAGLVLPGWSQDYAALHNLLIGFFSYQRAGIAGDVNPHNPFYTKSPYPHSGDKYSGQDMSGGWYDAGDFVKFGLPLGSSVYTLLKGYEAFPRSYDDKYGPTSMTSAADGIPDILNQVKYATDYIQKAVLSKSKVLMDMGIASQDHGGFPESGYANSGRTSGRGGKEAGGADVPGLYAAALALMATVYRKHDAAYADACIAKAKDAFAYGLTKKKISQGQTKHGATPYVSKAWEDKMALAGAELYRATKEQTYLDWAMEFQKKVKSHYFVVGYGHMGDYSGFTLNQIGKNATSQWTVDLNFYITRRVVTAPSASALIKNAFIVSDWGCAGNAGNAAFSAALAYTITGKEKYKDFCFQQVNWVSGNSPFSKSWIVGYKNGPKNPHHRNNESLGKKLKGAVISGPTPQSGWDPSAPEKSSWSFSDNAGNYKNSEPALDYNSGIIGAVAFMREFLNPPPGTIQIKTQMKAAKDPLDLNTDSQTITCTLAKSQAWTVLLKGEISGAEKRFTGTGSAIDVTWAGEADKGAFQVRENVVAQIESDLVASYHRGLSMSKFFILNLKKQAFKPTDVLLSDFNTGTLATAQGGVWSVFNDGKNSYTQPAQLLPVNSITTTGEGDTKGLTAILVGKAGAAHPHAGLKATVNVTGSPISWGNFSSVVLDIKSLTAGDSVRVEFEQAGITDGAYWGKNVALLSNSWVRMRIPVTAFSQPAWKTSDAAFDPGKLTALRITYYGLSNVIITIDNVHIEGLSIGAAVEYPKMDRDGAMAIQDLAASPDKLSYRFISPGAGRYRWLVQVLSINGGVSHRALMSLSGDDSAIRHTGLNLKKGVYILSQETVNGPFRYTRKFALTK